jgi:chromosome segregation ATPase
VARHEEELESLREAGEELEAERDRLHFDVAELTTARDEAMATLADRDEEIERLNAELRNAKQVAMEALVGKAKDQLAIEGKDAQLADLRSQIEKNVTATATLSDARLAAEMELVGAKTARDSLDAENKDLRAQIAALRKKS